MTAHRNGLLVRAPSTTRSALTTLVGALCFTACSSSSTPPPTDATAPSDASDAATDVRDAHITSDVSTRCPSGVTPAYPTAPSTVNALAPLPDLRFDTTSGSVSLHDWYTPCAATPKVLVIRTLTAWSGPSQHAAAHTQRIMTLPEAERVALLDLMALGPDNTRPSTVDLIAWRQRYDMPPAALALDPAYSFQPLYTNFGELPLYVFVDTRTMRVINVLVRPSSAQVTYAMSAALATIDGRPTPSVTPEALFDHRFTRDELEMILAMRAPTAPPPDPTNRVADDPRAVMLGETLFNDTGFSSNGMVSCATCHAAASLYTDGHPQGLGLARGDRNTPTVLLAPHARWIFHDGRVDTLWAQAIGPPENPIEMGFTRLQAAHRIAERYATQYTALFGALPALDNATRFPPSGMPGQASWDAMAEADRDAINRVYVNMGKAIAAFERTLRFPTTAFDRYVAGDTSALTDVQRDGLHLFFADGCIQCHHGPTLSDDSFHNIGMPTGHRDGMPDRGRVDAIGTLMTSAFRSDGVYSDDRTAGAHIARILIDATTLGQFHTPTLRGVSRTGPWGHGGTFTTLEDVMTHYSNGLRLDPVAGTIGTRDLHLPWFHISNEIQAQLVGLLNAM